MSADGVCDGLRDDGASPDVVCMVFLQKMRMTPALLTILRYAYAFDGRLIMATFFPLSFWRRFSRMMW